MEWNNDLILEFLGLYEQEPVIWNPKHPKHKYRNEVADAWKRIEASISVECPVKELKKKKDSLMAIFRHLLNKVNASMRMGNGSDDIYKPNWFAYETMSKFLQEVYLSKTTISTEGLEDENSTQHDNEENEDEESEDVANNLDVTEILSRTRIPENFCKPAADRGTRKRKRLVVEATENHVLDVGKVMKNAAAKPVKDDCSLYAELLARKLRALNEDTREILMNEIDNLVFRAKMNKNTQDSQPIPSPTSHFPFGSFHSAPTVHLYNYPPYSHTQHHSDISLPSQFHSQPSPAAFSQQQPSPGGSYSQPSPGHYHSQPSPANSSHSQPIITHEAPPTVPSWVENA